MHELILQMSFWLLPVAAGAVAAPAAVASSAGAHEARAQVQRGAASFDKLCSRCHSKDLGGGIGPALKGDRFTALWLGKPARALYSRILLSMPLDNPGTLQPEQVMDLAAFIISVNNFQPSSSAFTSPQQMSKVTLRTRE